MSVGHLRGGAPVWDPGAVPVVPSRPSTVAGASSTFASPSTPSWQCATRSSKPASGPPSNSRKAPQLPLVRLLGEPPVQRRDPVHRLDRPQGVPGVARQVPAPVGSPAPPTAPGRRPRAATSGRRSPGGAVGSGPTRVPRTGPRAGRARVGASGRRRARPPDRRPGPRRAMTTPGPVRPPGGQRGCRLSGFPPGPGVRPPRPAARVPGDSVDTCCGSDDVVRHGVTATRNAWI